MKTIIAIRDFCYKGKTFNTGEYFDMDKNGCHVTEAASLLTTGYLGWGDPMSTQSVVESDESTKRKYTPRAKKDE